MKTVMVMASSDVYRPSLRAQRSIIYRCSARWIASLRSQVVQVYSLIERGGFWSQRSPLVSCHRGLMRPVVVVVDQILESSLAK